MVHTEEQIKELISASWKHLPIKPDISVEDYFQQNKRQFRKFLIPPPHVVNAQNHIAYSNSDMGFMGSPQYDEAVKIVKEYFDEDRQTD